MISDTDKLFFKENQYLILDNFVSEDICDNAIDTVKNLIERNKYFNRTLENYMYYWELNKTPPICNTIKEMCISTYRELTNSEPNPDISCRVQVYPHGAFIREHSDGIGGGSLSFSVSLNDREGDGGFLKVDNKDIDCFKGRVIIMDSDSVKHEVTNVKNWTRYNVISFIKSEEGQTLYNNAYELFS